MFKGISLNSSVLPDTIKFSLWTKKVLNSLLEISLQSFFFYDYLNFIILIRLDTNETKRGVCFGEVSLPRIPWHSTHLGSVVFKLTLKIATAVHLCTTWPALLELMSHDTLKFHLFQRQCPFSLVAVLQSILVQLRKGTFNIFYNSTHWYTSQIWSKTLDVRRSTWRISNDGCKF